MKYRLKIVQGDITQLKVDAIVNAANTSLLGGGGVDGAIHSAAGPQLLAKCKELNGCLTGHAKITSGYELSAKYIIHTVGPIWRGGTKGEAQQLAACYTSSLKLALENNIKSLAFPAISCGVYGYPLAEAAIIAVKETGRFLEQYNTMENIYFVCFDETTHNAYQQALSALTNDE